MRFHNVKGQRPDAIPAQANSLGLRSHHIPKANGSGHELVGAHDGVNMTKVWLVEMLHPGVPA